MEGEGLVYLSGHASPVKQLDAGDEGGDGCRVYPQQRPANSQRREGMAVHSREHGRARPLRKKVALARGREGEQVVSERRRTTGGLHCYSGASLPPVYTILIIRAVWTSSVSPSNPSPG